MKNHWESDLDSMKKKMENIQTKKTNGYTWKSPFSAPCPGLFPTTLHFSVLSFLLQFNQYLFFFFKTLRKTALSPSMLSPLPFRKPPLVSLSFSSSHCICPFSSGFAFPTISAAATFLHHTFCSHLFFSLIRAPWRPTRPPSRKFFHVSKSYCSFKKSEVDSLWPLRMWHMARWDSDTWLKIWSAKTNRGKGDLCLNGGLHIPKRV